MRPPWKHRRRIVYGTLGFCAGSIVYLMVYGQADSRLHETIAYGLIGTAIAVIGSYVFGATWDDRNVMKTLGAAAYRDPAADIPEGWPADVAPPEMKWADAPPPPAREP